MNTEASSHGASPATYIALGANLPHGGLSGRDLLRAGLDYLAGRGVATLRLSGFWVSPAWPPSEQPDFVNSVARIDPGENGPEALYDLMREAEAAFGRERRTRWAARTLDLDLIDYQGLVGDFGAVSLPHARLHERAFVLAPLAEIAADWRHPILDRSAATLLADLSPEVRVAQAVVRLPD